MTSPRRTVLDWAEQGHIAPADLPRALAVAEVLPSRAAWRHFIDQLLLWLGVLLVTAGVIFFFAFNWNEIDRLTKFALAEALVVIALGFIWWSGVDRLTGKAALVGASLLVGALFALIGQTYQTGADSFELFGTWAAAILPWVLVSRFNLMWLVWLLLANLAVVTYFYALGIFAFGVDRVAWMLFAVNTAALAIWELAALRGVEWLRPRWAPRLVAIASCGAITLLLLARILGGDGQTGTLWVTVAWVGWLAAALAVYRRRLRDVFVLSGGVLSVIVVVATFVIRQATDFGGYIAASLLVGVLVIALSAAGGMWLKSVSEEVEP